MIPIENKVVSPEDQILLAMAAKDGDKQALSDLIVANIKYIMLIAKQYQGQGVEIEDLISEGIIGYIRAVEKFDPSLGNRFITYAGWWIKQGMLQALTEQHQQVRIPANRVVIHEKVKKVANELRQKHHREPSTTEIANELKIETYDITPIGTNFSYFSKEDSEHRPFLDVTPDPNAESPDEIFALHDLQFSLDELLEQLSEKEAKIIKMSFGYKYPRAYTLEEIGLEFNLTRERVRQIKENALKKLQKLDLSELYD